MTQNLSRRVAAEFVGTAFLLIAVVGSGIMAERLAAGNVALALLCNAIATGATLVVLILAFGPISGAHFNPVVSLVFALRKNQTHREALTYVACQIAGAVAGVLIAHAMFALPLFQVSQTARFGEGQWIAEIVATFGLLLTILLCLRVNAASVAYAVGLYITAAYWFTASTSFANPAVTIARSLTDSFAGIHPADAAPFIVAQLLGALIATGVCVWLFEEPDEARSSNGSQTLPPSRQPERRVALGVWPNARR